MGNAKDNIDTAFSNFCVLLPELNVWAGSISSEQDTRLKIIDPKY